MAVGTWAWSPLLSWPRAQPIAALESAVAELRRAGAAGSAPAPSAKAAAPKKRPPARRGQARGGQTAGE